MLMAASREMIPILQKLFYSSLIKLYVMYMLFTQKEHYKDLL